MATDPRRPETLGELVPAVSRRLRRRTGEALTPLGITPHHARALRVVVRDGPMRLRDLAEALRIAPRSVTDVVDHLEDRGLLARSPDPGDRRATVITATTAGTALSAEVEAARREAADDLFAGLTAPQRAELARLLRRLVDDPC